MSNKARTAQEKVCAEILAIMNTYHEQEEEPGGVSTPGGLEHMGDVWRLFMKWEEMLAKSPKSSPLPAEPEQTGLRGRIPGDVVWLAPRSSLLPGWVILPSGIKLNLATVRRIVDVTGANMAFGLQLMFSDSWTLSIWNDDATALDKFLNESAEWDLREPSK